MGFSLDVTEVQDVPVFFLSAPASGCLCPNVLILEKGDNWIYG
jgi:hypothetical protein